MTTRQYIIARIDAFLSLTGMTDRAFSIEAIGHDKWLRRLRTGDGTSLKTIERAEAFMRDHPHTPDQAATGESHG